MKGKGKNTGGERLGKKPDGLEAAARVLAAGGRVPKKFARAAAAEQVARRPQDAGPTLGQREAQARLSPARRVAFDILQRMGEGRGHADDLLRGPGMDGLSEADRHLATALVMGVLRWQIALDATVRTLLDRPGQKLAEEVSIALRLGAFQLLHMDRIPAHAALSESVELCRAAGQPHASGMVNAILRRVAAGKARSGSADGDLPRPAAGPIFERTAVMAERLGHPAWLVERWERAFGRPAAVAICEADQREPGGNDNSAGEGAEDPNDRNDLDDETDSKPPTVAAEPVGTRLPAMDAGSRLVAEIAAAAMPAVKGRAARVWDCCAAPGGKTMVLAARLPGAEMLATDVSERRLRAMGARLREQGVGPQVQVAAVDAANLPASAGEFDLVLCDVPCSGTGTLARNPEIRLRLTPEDLGRQAVRQREILAAALRRVAPGGRLVYSTCSLEREENEGVVEAVAAGWRRVPIEVKEARSRLTAEGALQTLPGRDPCDGFYAVVLERAPEEAAAAE